MTKADSNELAKQLVKDHNESLEERTKIEPTYPASENYIRYEHKPRHTDFNDLVDRRCDLIRQTLIKKSSEYAPGADRFEQFKIAARKRNIIPELALEGMMAKHETAVMFLVDWIESNPEKITHELIDEKIGDNINYLILLEGMLKERLQK